MHESIESQSIESSNENRLPTKQRILKYTCVVLIVDAYFRGTLGEQPPRPEPQLTESEQIVGQMLRPYIEPHDDED